MRIAIVNDLPLAVEAMRRVVRGVRGHRVAWIAHDGAEAVSLCVRDKPDLILMDLVMPIMDGVEATRRIMTRTPCPIVIVTASVDARSSKVFEALGAGALDAVNTPMLDQPGTRSDAPGLIAKINTIEKLVYGRSPARPAGGQSTAAAGAGRRYPLVAIGASAGGPAALARILSVLPKDFPAAMVILQHVDAEFTPGLAAWLASQSRLPVRVAREGERPQAGAALMAGRDDHLVLTEATRLEYTSAAKETAYRPSIDLFFKSAARHWNGEAIGVLLTGMGRDGAEGLLAMRKRGWTTLAQNAATCAVYGMPKAAVEIQAASEIVPLEKIAPRLLKLLSHNVQPHV
jgi:two-component system, chemotaxis family, response regulator WspF